jgi:hypothetical protein
VSLVRMRLLWGSGLLQGSSGWVGKLGKYVRMWSLWGSGVKVG